MSIFDMRQLEDILNQTKDILLSKLKKEDIITKEQEEHFSKTMVVIIKRKGKISRFFKKMIGKDQDEEYIMIAKIGGYDG